jgi:hypothetical protein
VTTAAAALDAWVKAIEAGLPMWKPGKDPGAGAALAEARAFHDAATSGGAQLARVVVGGTETFGVWGTFDGVDDGCGYLEIYAASGALIEAAYLDHFTATPLPRDELRAVLTGKKRPPGWKRPQMQNL